MGSACGHIGEIRCYPSTCACLLCDVTQISTSLAKGPHCHHRLQHTLKDDWKSIVSMASIPHNPFVVPYWLIFSLPTSKGARHHIGDLFEDVNYSWSCWWTYVCQWLFGQPVSTLSPSRLLMHRFETFLLHGIRKNDLKNHDNSECHHFTSVIVY